jgi:hypothetical protein
MASDIIHAEGVRVAVPSSALQARKALSLQADLCVPMKTINHRGVMRLGSHVICPLAKTALPGGKGPFTWSWCWVTFGERKWSFLASAEVLGHPTVRHWVLVVSLDSRNVSERVDSVLIVPFGSQGAEGPTTLRLEPWACQGHPG